MKKFLIILTIIGSILQQVPVFSMSNNNILPINSINVFVKFRDSVDELTAEDVANLNNSFNSEDGSKGSLKSYYKKTSQGKIDPTYYMYPQKNNTNYYFTLSQTRWYYESAAMYSDTEKQMLMEIFDMLQNESLPDGNTLDVMGNLPFTPPDGCIDSINIFYEGIRKPGNNVLWSHKNTFSSYDTEVLLRGKKVDVYTIDAVGDRNYGLISGDKGSTSTTIHEFGHTLGLPDLYRYNKAVQGNPVGSWDIMSLNNTPAQYPLVYTKQLFWNIYDENQVKTINKSGKYEVTVADTMDKNATIAYKIPTRVDGEFIVLEYRHRRAVFDSVLYGDGLIIYRVNENAPGRGNTEGPPDLIYVYRPSVNSIQSPYGDLRNSYLSGDAKTQSFGNTDFSKPFNEDTIFLSNGQNTGIKVYNVGLATGNTISFEIFIPPMIDENFIYTADERVDLRLLTVKQDADYVWVNMRFNSDIAGLMTNLVTVDSNNKIVNIYQTKENYDMLKIKKPKSNEKIKLYIWNEAALFPLLQGEIKL